MTQTISVKDADAMVKNGEAVLVDVREADEFKEEHIPYAMSVPLSSLEEGVGILNIPEDTAIIFQCLKGSRSKMACERIQGLSSCNNKLLNFHGGIEAWKEGGYPVIGSSSPSSGLSIFRQVQIIVGFIVAACVVLGFVGLKPAFAVAGVVGAALFTAGLTGWCGLAMILVKMPWNKVS
ncbi:MAG: rhodanese-like domain-containing protein [Alphaproteobacteria bacterium]